MSTHSRWRLRSLGLGDATWQPNAHRPHRRCTARHHRGLATRLRQNLHSEPFDWPVGSHRSAGLGQPVAGQFTAAARLVAPCPLGTAVETVAMMPAKREPRRYTGVLASPIIQQSPPPFEGAVTKKRVAEYWEAHARHEQQTESDVNRLKAEKLSLLMVHYGIDDKNDMAALALALASEHVPGFKVVIPKRSAAGRKRAWDSSRFEALIETVQSVKGRLHCSDRTALTFMANNQQYAQTWGPPTGHKGVKRQWIETLESRLADAKRFEKLAQSTTESFQKFAQELSAKFRK